MGAREVTTRPRDAGLTSIELVSYVFVLAMIALVCVQGVFLTQVTSAAQQAARDGARAASLGRDVDHEVRRALPHWATVESISLTTPSDAYRVEVRVRVPVLLRGVTSSSFVVTRDAILPRG
ncbi:hypothetical protein [Cellulomonas dongxiuzhuiae]|uniref:Pilus assembly protein n=1 Tax=Cellulomonas dongxiuzhuiae TaxID=2819979 RepID=A0ABX8GHH1_9CELL|nr:hypothetical protein [Cellulomonas dongxiuzhuiae]MBO3088544.1 hypothetical protein [Cellulomonas dongxiuzhuiae]MBO3094123.1 hypothetical protein [Cellulomonas dongxiuzhuiae]QWC15187.1 hypothetical protein KKR89_12740 [Cellulomonas dongxiuzhuiae]